MFRDERQQVAVCRALLKRVRLERLWTHDGPTEEAVDLLEASPLSHGEHLMLRVAFDFWNGRGEARLAELLATLDGPNLRAIGTLLGAMADSSEIEQWLDVNGG